MRILLLTISSTLLFAASAISQTNIDTIAIQDFESAPAIPTWNYTGTLAGTQTGYAPGGSCIPGTPLGIDGSTAWHVVQVSGGNPIVFNNTSIPPVYDSVFVSFRLAGLNLIGSTGGPDDLDYVLVEYSLDGGATYTARVRVRGAVNNNSFWPYDATGEAVVDYLPATESVFQPINSGLQMTEGISFVEIGFPGSISQLALRITPRSSSASDSWLVDNVLLTGKNTCSNTSSTISPIACDSYTAPSGTVYTTSGSYTDIIPNATGCDSVITVNLTVNQSDSINDVISACGSYTWIDGNTYTSSNNTASLSYTNMAGCDSTIYLDLTINPNPDNTVTQTGPTLTSNESAALYQWLDCDNSYAVIAGATNASYTPTNITGNYAVEVNLNGCIDTSACFLVDYTGIEELSNEKKELLMIIDLMGRETEYRPNTPLIFIYSDGTRERVMKIED